MTKTLKTLAGRTHGRAGTYTYGCRCALCRQAWREYRTNNDRQWAHRRARNRIGEWAIANHPDVYARLLAEALAERSKT